MIENWKPKGIDELELEAEKAIIEKSNTIIIAGPGAGKTELLAQKALYLFENNICKNPQKILAISFKKDAAKNLSDRIHKRGKTKFDNQFISRTYDSFFKGILDQFILALPKNYSLSSNYKIINITRGYIDILADDEIKDADLQGINSYIFERQYMCGKPLWELSDNSFEEKVALKLWKYLLSRNEVSFLMISRLCELILHCNPVILKCLRITYSHVFLDEFQDTTKIQYSILKLCFLDSKTNITAVGDNKQRIMGWAGALDNIFNIYKRDFHANDFFLHMNFRSSPALIRIQQRIMKLLAPNENIIIKSNKEDLIDEKESCKLFIFNDQIQEAIEVSKVIKELLKDENPREICILVRQKCDSYSANLIKQLNNLEIKARIEDPFQELLSEPIIVLLIAVINLSITKKDVKSFEIIKDYFEYLDEEFDDEDIKKTKILIKQEIELKSDLNNIIQIILNYLDLTKVISLYPQYIQKENLIRILTNFKDIFNSLLKNNNNDYKKSIKDFLGNEIIPIMTIHKSKGLEYNIIIFLGLEDSAFWNYKNDPSGENCAFFVAFSRARKKVFFTFSKKRDGRYGYSENQHNEYLRNIYKLLYDAGITIKQF